jgi:hypothetical protein
MPKPKARRLHIASDPPVEMILGDTAWRSTGSIF